jgi:putative ABC transport system permease protein
VVGVIDQFPTVKRGSAGFIVADGPSLLGHLNAVNVGRDVWPNETFLDFSDDPLAREAALAAIESNDTLSGEIIDQQELRDQSRRSPLASAGWRGLTVLAVVASIVALLLGVTAHGIAAAQERTLDMAVLRALGFARRRALHSLLIEYLVIAGLAIPAGVALGLWLSRIMVPLFLNLGADPVAPDLVLALDWRIFVGVISVVVVGALAVALALWRTYVSLNVANVLRAGRD